MQIERIVEHISQYNSDEFGLFYGVAGHLLFFNERRFNSPLRLQSDWEPQ